ncbi:MAG: CcoQ/FixQ family Cbb3-type cytochrome c oxidase assembly chaperone [Rubrivivax sp.]
MDVNDLRIAVTLVSLLLFVALVWHTWSRRRKPEFEHAAMLPFSGDLLTETPREERS